MRRRAFTLLELLVVIAVIGCLMAVILPCLRYSKYQAQSVVCAANLRQLTLLMNNYAQFQTSYPPGFYGPSGYSSPPPGGYVGNIAYDRVGWWWFHFLIDEQDGKPVLDKMVFC